MTAPKISVTFSDTAYSRARKKNIEEGYIDQ